MIALISPSDNCLNDRTTFAHSTLGSGGTSCKSDEIAHVDSMSFRMSSIKVKKVKSLYLTSVVSSATRLVSMEANGAPFTPLPLSVLRFKGI